jgi:outer membrane protein assembly factor BamB
MGFHVLLAGRNRAQTKLPRLHSDVLALLIVPALFALACGGSNSGTTTPPAASPAPPSEWPMYGHDAAHTNTNASETAFQAANVGSLAQAWQANIGFNGSLGSNSTPSISGGIVYVGSSIPAGPNFLAFKADTGEPVWSVDLGHTSPAPCSLSNSVGIPSTPAISNGILVVGGGDSAYYAVDTATGGVMWRDPLGVGPSGFAWSSALISGGLAYFGLSSQCDNPSVRGEVRAVSVTTGTLMADQFFAPPGSRGGGVWNSPALSPDGNTLVVASGEDNGDNYAYEEAFVTLDPTTLTILGSNKVGPLGRDDDFGCSPVVFHDQTGRILGMSGLKTGTYYAYHLDSVSSGPAWTRTIGVAVGAMPAYDATLGSSGTVFAIGVEAGSHQQVDEIHALDPNTGQEIWAAPTIVGPVNNNIAIAGGLIFVNTGEEGLKILDETTGEILRTIVPANAGPAVSGVAVAEGAVYWVSGSYLNAWRPAP